MMRNTSPPSVKKEIFSSGRPGLKLLFFGAIHGNEKCGAQALLRFSQELSEEKLRLQRGQVQMIPICNPLAYEKNRRFMDDNLNRVLQKDSSGSSYERQLAGEICRAIDECDFLIDLHAFSSEGEAYAVMESAEGETRKIANCLGVSRVLTGFSKLYTGNGKIAGHTSTHYAQQIGKPAVVVECGHLADPQSTDFAYQVIRRVLNHFEMLPLGTNSSAPFVEIYRFTHMFLKERAGQLEKKFQEGELVSAGQTLAIYEDGKPIIAPEDAYVFFASPTAQIGTEWVYLAEKQQ